MVGFVVGASTLTGILVKLPAGASSDVVGRRPMLILGTIVFAVMPFTYLGVATLGALVTVRFLHGAATTSGRHSMTTPVGAEFDSGITWCRN